MGIYIMIGSGKSRYPCVKNPKTGKDRLSGKGKKCVRSFKVLTIDGKPGKGKFLSATPAQSASKAFSRWCRDNNKGSRCSTTVRVVETTRGGKGKTYGYNASRSWNKSDVKLNGKKINYKFSNKLHSQKQHKGGKRNKTQKKK